ncbi:hypothetical protein A0H81_09221 [Grifola frondosa]|uniref:Uncharacterized protein n=1 Tax=Grifola frondosa TaxID=5627 RepID=A0A1C7M3B5_GRIFR|nr:hypothetical protein A0H81_09221 [Grifola frondosa]
MTEEPSRPEPVFSFLDFSSSTSTSLSSGQPRSTRQSASNSNSGTSSSKSKRNTGSEHSARSQSINWASLSPDRRISLGLSMSIAGGPTTSHPSLIPNISLQPVALPPAVPPLPVLSAHLRDPSVPETEAEGPNQLFPYDAAGQLPSPTDSIPYTVSDIHFRHSVQSEFTQASDSRRTSVNRMSGLHRPPHPPLPGSAGPSSPTRPTHQREGSASESQVVPPFIVQRLLGMHPGSHQGTPFGSPTVPGFSGQGAAPSGTARPQTPQSAQQTPSTGTPAGASATTSAPPSSGTTVFGFQLGRHR